METPNPQDQITKSLSRASDDLETVILSDLDHTLCHDYAYDGNGNHLPMIDQSIVDVAKNSNLFIATGRRAQSQAIAAIWESGLCSEERPIIAENGGVLVYKFGRNIKYLDLLYPYQIKKLRGIKSQIDATFSECIPNDQQVITKLGRTMITARIQDRSGITSKEAHEWLTEHMALLLADSNAGFGIVDNRVSLAIQHSTTNKAEGFRRYIKMRHIKREKLYVVGMGDGENDRQIFREANLSIGFSGAVKSLVDVVVTPNEDVTTEVIQAINDQSN